MNAKCEVCGELFVGMEKGEYMDMVSKHILENHRDEPPDKPLVFPI